MRKRRSTPRGRYRASIECALVHKPDPIRDARMAEMERILAKAPRSGEFVRHLTVIVQEPTAWTSKY